MDQAQGGDDEASASSSNPTGASCTSIATGSSARSTTPRTPCKKPCSPPGGTAASRSGPRCGPGCTGSPQTAASTRCDTGRRRPDDDAVARRNNRRSRPAWARCSGSSPTPTSSSNGSPRPARPRSALRAQRSDLAGLHDRPAATPAPTTRGAHPSRRARVPRQRGSRDPRIHRGVGHQRPQARPGHPASPGVPPPEARRPPPPPDSPGAELIETAHSAVEPATWPAWSISDRRRLAAMPPRPWSTRP